MIISRSIHVASNNITSFFLCLNNIPLYICVCVCMCVRVYIYIYIYIYHIFFIHSSVDVHLDCFHVLAVVNNAALNIGVHIYFCIRAFIFSRYMPRRGIDSKNFMRETIDVFGL